MRKNRKLVRKEFSKFLRERGIFREWKRATLRRYSTYKGSLTLEYKHDEPLVYHILDCNPEYTASDLLVCSVDYCEQRNVDWVRVSIEWGSYCRQNGIV